MLKLEDLDLEMISTAMSDDRSLGAEFYLDLDTGGIAIASFDGEVSEADLERGNYAYIDFIGSHEAFRHMEGFVETLPAGSARSALVDALQRRKPFRNFTGALADFDAERTAWFEFKDATMRRAMILWLIGVKAIEDPGPAGT